MANWTGSFHAPKFTDAEFKKQKAKYVEKYGYTITIPSWDEIIHVPRFTPMTFEENYLWKRRRYDEIPPERVKEIRQHKEEKRQKYIAQLASPSPNLVRAAGAILTSLDDAQDAISTLACIGLLSAKLIGGAYATALTGPLGWVIGTAQFLQLINPYSRLKGKRQKPYIGRGAKKKYEASRNKNPFSKKSRAKTAKLIKQFKVSQANIVEALQTTDNMFGFGISIGPIMGFAQDLVAGAIRGAMGQPVKIKRTPRPVPEHVEKARAALKASGCLNGYPWRSDMLDEASSMIAANYALQVIHPYVQDWNPFDEVDDLASCEIRAPRPTDVLTLEIIEESGRTLDEVCNWPHNGKQWISLDELQEKTSSQATANLRHFAENYKESGIAYSAAQCAHDFALGCIETIEGLDQVDVEFPCAERLVLIILDQGWCYPDDITEEQVEKFEDWVYVHEYMNTTPSYKDIWRYAEVFCGFQWAKSEDETR